MSSSATTLGEEMNKEMSCCDLFVLVYFFGVYLAFLKAIVDDAFNNRSTLANFLARVLLWPMWCVKWFIKDFLRAVLHEIKR